MKGKLVTLLLLAVVATVGLYRHNGVRAATTITSVTADTCSRVTNKLECNADAAMIQNSYNACVKACPSRTDWYTYCIKAGDACESDCELLNADGRSADKVKACKAQCAKKEAECKASYRDKVQCASDCEQVRQQNLSDFNKRWTTSK